MIVAGLDYGGEATRLAAEGQAALSVGQTDRARERYAAAGEVLEAKLPGVRKAKDQHLTRFLAASQYYHGGDYQKALKLARKVDRKNLAHEVRSIFDKFFRDVDERATHGYAERMREQMLARWQGKDYTGLLKLLQEHPYILNQHQLALIRAFCFENLHDWQAAAVFYADALKDIPDDPEAVFHLAGDPLSLAGEGKIEEAWKYVQYQLKAMPNAVTFITASIIRFQQANAIKGTPESLALIREQIQYFSEAWQHYQQLPPKVRDYQDIRKYMVLCFEMVNMGLRRLGDEKRAREVCDLAISFAPNEASLRSVRGITTYPSDEAMEDFREAVRLGDRNYYPYYFLAHARSSRTNSRKPSCGHSGRWSISPADGLRPSSICGPRWHESASAALPMKWMPSVSERSSWIRIIRTFSRVLIRSRS